MCTVVAASFAYPSVLRAFITFPLDDKVHPNRIEFILLLIFSTINIRFLRSLAFILAQTQR